MRKDLIISLLVGLVLILSTSTNLVAKSIDADNGGYTAKDKEYYLTEAQIAVAFPGLDLKILSIEIPDDLTPLVTFSIQNTNGLPLDINGVFTPGPVDIRFMLTYIPAGEEQKDKYYEGTRDQGGVFTTIEQGLYTYKFTTVLPADYEVDATHTLGGVATRDLREEYELGRYYDNELYDFIPSGSGIPKPRDVVATATCNRCHDPLSMHGGRYQEVGICGQCHNPSLVSRRDPESSKSLDVIVHQVHMEMEDGYPPILNDCEVCHTGGTPSDGFPMVAGPNPTPVCDGTGLGATTIDWAYPGNVEIRIDSADGKLFAMGGPIGSAETGKWVMDGREFFLLDSATGDEVQELAVDTTVFGCPGNAPGTFRGEAAMQHTRWMERPSRRVCGSCHEHIDFETGEGHLAQSNDDNCAFCHQPDSGEEYDRSVNGAHQVDYKSAQLGGVLVEILEIDNATPGERPRVTFSLNDKNGPLDPAKLNRLLFAITGPNKDFAYYVQEDGLSNLQKTGTNWTYQFSTRMPNDAAGSYSMGVEGRITGVVINEGEDNEFTMSDQMQNFIVPFAVTGSEAEPRLMVVDDAKCENCHSNLTLHGSNRHGATGYCQTCHRADATDVNRRPADGEDQSIHFKYMIHKIHRGEDLARGYVVYGYGNSKHDFSHVEFPGDLRNCESCHEEGAYNLPLPMGRLDTVAPQDFWSPMQPIAAACLACHDGIGAAAHAASNTNEIGEACVACHGEDRSFSVEEVEEVHAR